MTRRTFVLYRHEDVSGVSGTGPVAEGAEFSDGAVAVRWTGERPSTASWGSVEDVTATHGHGGKTQLVWDEEIVANSRTPLQRMADYIATGATYHSVSSPWRMKRGDRFDIHVSPDDWGGWLDAMGGSPDASVFIDREDDYFPQERRWTSPDGVVTVLHLVYKGDRGEDQ